MKKPKKKKTINPAEGVKYTVCGEWFPEVYPASPSQKWSRGEENPLGTEMRLFSACERWAFNRLLEGRSREELKRQGQEVFGLNSRYTDDAIMKAGAVIESQKELLALEIEETESKLSRAKKKLRWAEKDLEKAIKANEPAKIEEAKRTLRGRKARVKKLAVKLAELQEHEANDTIPKVVFGGRSLWRRVCRGKASREEWRNARQNRLYARGDETKGGNPNLKVAYQEGRFTLAVTISHLSEQKGTDRKGRPVMTRAPRVTGKLWLPEKSRNRVWKSLYSGAPYSVELIRGQDGRYRVHVTFSLKRTEGVTNSNLGYLGIDTNPDGVALANVNHLGQPEPWPEDFAVPSPRALHKWAGEFQVMVQSNGFLYIRIPELAYGGGFRRTYLIGVLAKGVVDIAKTLGKALAVENLDFSKDRLDTNKRFNRMATNFPFQKMVEAVLRRADKEGVGVKMVWPAHTSTIGWWKYRERYGITVHEGAALAIARRALGFKEKIAGELKEKLKALQRTLEESSKRKERLKQKGKPNQAVDSLPGEGKGMTRKVKRLFGRLDGKILRHNGLDRFKQESLTSVWHDLKELALLSR
jgi:IS605 OrfB family transposase